MLEGVALFAGRRISATLLLCMAWWVTGCANLPSYAPPPVASAGKAKPASMQSQSSAATAPSKTPIAAPVLANTEASVPAANITITELATDATQTSPNAQPQSAARRDSVTGWTESGIASWYGPRFQGKLTANGERFNTHELTAAHKTLPFGTRVRVKSQVNGKEVIVRINDRGPFIPGRIIDLSHAAAQAIGLVGVKKVEIERLR
jgi:rare lipoprotein A